MTVLAEALRYGDDPQQVVEVWAPAGRSRGTAVLVHGGYWRTPWAADLMHPLVPAFLERGWRVAVPEYRRIGSGGGWPETSDDVAAGLAAALGEQDDDGRVVLVGHSAGGHLALLHAGVAHAVVALAPVTDLVRGHAEGIGRGAVAELVGVSPDADPAVYAAASPRLRPWPACPVLVVHGTDDDRVPVEHSRDYAAAARAGGAPVELVEPASLDHMALIDPAAPHWPSVHAWLDTTLRRDHGLPEQQLFGKPMITVEPGAVLAVATRLSSALLPSEPESGRSVHRVLRSHSAGTLRAAHDGEQVTLAGWVGRRRDHGGVAFLDLRDASGVVQVVVRDELLESSGAHALRSEFVVQVTGAVRLRPVGNENPALPTGDVEVVAEVLTVLNEAAPLPFPIESAGESVSPPGEEVRLRHRYLDLRRPAPAAALKLRSEANRVARDVLLADGFTEVETPTLTRSTPEGARDFLVPARLAPGSWYALPQSPQLFKQLLMVAGVEKYFQIARCYRDEDFRADRQPEFTQLDVEMAFVEQDDVIALAEKVLVGLWSLIGYELGTPIPRMTYRDAMARYGSDKPDLRFGVELVDVTSYFADTTFRVFQAPYVGAVVMPGGASQPRKQLDAWQEFAKQRGHRGLAYVLVGEDGELSGPVAKNLSETEREGLAAKVGAVPGDCIFFAAGAASGARSLLGATRLEIGKRCGLIDESQWAFVWVVDAPLFEPAEAAVAAGDVAVGGGAWTAVHHAFTSPKPEHLDTFDSTPEAPGEALAYAYDIVCNGNEIGGGSIRIHRRDVQERVFRVMGISPEDAQEKFGFLLDAFGYGAPPHGGIAFGWDRIVALLTRSDSIREVIAFPKSGGGYDPLTAAPAPITPAQRAEAGIDGPPKKPEPKADPKAAPAT